MPLQSALAVLAAFGQYPMEAQAPCAGLSHGRLLARKSKTIIASRPAVSSQRLQPRATIAMAAWNASRSAVATSAGSGNRKDAGRTQTLRTRLTGLFSGWAPSFVALLLTEGTPERAGPREGPCL